MVSWLKKQSFQPSLLGIVINPFFFLRRGLYLRIKKLSPQLSGDLLDFGCGRKPYRELFTVNRYIGVDIEVSGHPHTNSQVDVFYDGKKIPFDNASFDSFFCSEVFEHLFNLEEILDELHRVLKPGGKGLITVPFAWPEHEVPYDFGRYTSFAMKAILERHGFSIVTLEKSGHFFEVLVQLWANFVYSIFHTKNLYINTLCTAVLVFPFNLLGGILSWILPKRKEMYHNLIILVEKRA